MGMARNCVASSACRECVCRSEAVVCDLDAPELAAFEGHRHVLTFAAGQTVFYEGHACLGLYLLCRGKVKLTRSSSQGQRHIVGILSAGRLLDPQAFRPGAVHETTCDTLEPSQVGFIERTAYLALLQRDPSLAIRLIQWLGDEIRKGLGHVDLLAFKTARQRLAGLLADLAERFGRQAGLAGEPVEIGVCLKREELAELAGITLETAVRVLGALRQDGLVRLDGRRIVLLDRPRLLKIARA